MEKWFKILLWIIGGLWAFVIFLIIILPNEPTIEEERVDVRKSVSIGEEGKLQKGNNTMVTVCNTKEYLNELTSAIVTNDNIGYNNLIMSSGKKCYVTSTIGELGNVLVLDRTIGKSKFRFTSPESFNYGKIAWTYKEYIIPEQEVKGI